MQASWNSTRKVLPVRGVFFKVWSVISSGAETRLEPSARLSSPRAFVTDGGMPQQPASAASMASAATRKRPVMQVLRMLHKKIDLSCKQALRYCTFSVQRTACRRLCRLFKVMQPPCIRFAHCISLSLALTHGQHRQPPTVSYAAL